MIELRGVVKRHSDEVCIGPVDLDIQAGGVTALVGPNGAGKSTLLTMIGRLQDADAGTIAVGGHDITTTPSRRIAQTLSILRQENHFVTRLTVRQLVGFGRYPYTRGRLTLEDERHVSDAIDFLNLGPFENRYLDQLSGGQRQRAYVAMVLAQNTEYVLLDEPLNNLDMQHSVQMMQQLRRAADELGRTVVIVLHDINFAAHYADRIVAMGDGQVVETGTPAEILRPEVLERIFKTPCRWPCTTERDDGEVGPGRSGRGSGARPTRAFRGQNPPGLAFRGQNPRVSRFRGQKHPRFCPRNPCAWTAGPYATATSGIPAVRDLCPSSEDGLDHPRISLADVPARDVQGHLPTLRVVLVSPGVPGVLLGTPVHLAVVLEDEPAVLEPQIGLGGVPPPGVEHVLQRRLAQPRLDERQPQPGLLRRVGTHPYAPERRRRPRSSDEPPERPHRLVQRGDRGDGRPPAARGPGVTDQVVTRRHEGCLVPGVADRAQIEPGPFRRRHP